MNSTCTGRDPFPSLSHTFPCIFFFFFTKMKLPCARVWRWNVIRSSLAMKVERVERSSHKLSTSVCSGGGRVGDGVQRHTRARQKKVSCGRRRRGGGWGIDRPSRPSQQSQHRRKTRRHYISPEAVGADNPAAHLSFDFSLFPFRSFML